MTIQSNLGQWKSHVQITKLWHLFFHTWKMNNIDQVAFQFCQSSFRLAQIKVSNILLNNLKPKKMGKMFSSHKLEVIDLAYKTLAFYYSLPDIWDFFESSLFQI